ALSFPCRGRLPAMGTRSWRDRAQQSARGARHHERGAPGRCRTSGLYLVGGGVEARQRRGGRRNLAPYAAKRDRCLQAQQAGGRARGRTADRRGKSPCRIVAPSTPIGPRDIKPTPTGRIIV